MPEMHKSEMIKYLPPVVQNIREAAAVAEIEQPLFDRAWEAVSQVLLEQFLLKAGIYGVERWEKMLGIVVRDGMSLDERRMVVMLRLAEQLPFTMERLRESFDIATMGGDYTLELEEQAFCLKLRLALNSKRHLPVMLEVLRRIAPANLQIELQLLYNTYAMLEGYRHEDLGALSYGAVREEVLA